MKSLPATASPTEVEYQAARALMAVVIIAAAVITPDLACAQAGAGTTGAAAGLIGPAIDWVMTNFLGGLIEIGVIVGGVILMFMRLHISGIVTMIVGSLVVTNYQTIAALL